MLFSGPCLTSPEKQLLCYYYCSSAEQIFHLPEDIFVVVEESDLFLCLIYCDFFFKCEIQISFWQCFSVSTGTQEILLPSGWSVSHITDTGSNSDFSPNVRPSNILALLFRIWTQTHLALACGCTPHRQSLYFSHEPTQELPPPADWQALDAELPHQNCCAENKKREVFRAHFLQHACQYLVWDCWIWSSM